MKEDVELDLLLKYPLITSDKHGSTLVYKGMLQVNDSDFKVEISERKSTLNSSYHIDITPKSEVLQNAIRKLCKQTKEKNIVNVLDELKLLLKHIAAPSVLNYSTIYKRILYEYFEFSKFYLNLKTCMLSEDLKSVKVSTLDEKSREHFVEISINYEEPQDIFVVTKFDLPQEEGKQLFRKCNSLTALYDQFLGAVESFQPFFDLMDVFDENADILEPEQPRKTDVYRRISLGSNISLILTVDPFNVGLRPNMKFLGPEKEVEHFRENLNKNLDCWNDTANVYNGILNLLELECFPRKLRQIQNEEYLLRIDGECSICFSLRLNGKTPEVVCNNQCCGNVYHVACLYEKGSKMWMAYASQHWVSEKDLRSAVKRLSQQLEALCFDASHAAVYDLDYCFNDEEVSRMNKKAELYSRGFHLCEEFLRNYPHYTCLDKFCLDLVELGFHRYLCDISPYLPPHLHSSFNLHPSPEDYEPFDSSKVKCTSMCDSELLDLLNIDHKTGMSKSKE